MNEQLQPALAETLGYLMSLTQEGTRPEEAQARLRPLRERHPGVRLDLLWEEEAYGHSVHYDALLHLDGAGTVSLSFCPDRALPWVLRGVHRWSDKDLLRVNGTVLKVDQAIACLDFIWDEARLLGRLVNACLVQEALERDPVEVSDTELQRTMDAFRRARKLHTAEDTRRWMEQNGLTHEKLEHLVADEATVAKLRDRVTAGRVEGYFAEHRAGFDTAAIARFALPDEASARKVQARVVSGELDFYEAAQARFLEAGGLPKPPAGGLFARLQRRQAGPELAGVFAAVPGEVLGPFRTEEGHELLRVLSVTPAGLDEPTRAAVRQVLFEDWLGERRCAARIEWCWGNADRTAQAS